MRLKTCVIATLSMAFVFVTSVSAFDTQGSIVYAEIDTTRSSSSVNSNVSGSGTLRFTNMALNEDSGMSIGVPVALAVEATTRLNYHYSGSTCYGDSVVSSISYENDIYNPEVCEYSADIENISMETDGDTYFYYSSDFEEQSVITSPDYSGSSYLVEVGETLIDEAVIISTIGAEWSNCITPYQYGTFTLTVPIS